MKSSNAATVSLFTFSAQRVTMKNILKQVIHRVMLLTVNYFRFCKTVPSLLSACSSKCGPREWTQLSPYQFHSCEIN